MKYVVSIALLMAWVFNTQAQSYQFRDAAGQLIIDETFKSIKHSETTFVPVQQGELWRLLDLKKGMLVDGEYQDMANNGASPHFFAVKKEGLWGIIDTSGKVVLPIQYDEIKSYDEEVAIVSMDFYWVLVNFKGEKLVDNEYEKVSKLGQMGLWFEKDEKYDLYSRTGKKLFTQTGWMSLDNVDGAARQIVSNGWHKTGAFDMKMEKVVVPLTYNQVKLINEDLVEVAKCKRPYDGYGPRPRPSDFLYGIYSVSLKKEIVPCTYDKVTVKESYIKADLVGYATKSSYYSYQGKTLNPDKLLASAGIEQYDFLEVLPISKTAFAIQAKDRKWGIAHYEKNNMKWKTFPRGSFEKVENVKTGEKLLPFVLFIGYSSIDVYDVNGEKVKHLKCSKFEKKSSTASTVTYEGYDTESGKAFKLVFSENGSLTEKAADLLMPFKNADRKYGIKKSDGTVVVPAAHLSIRGKSVEGQTFFVVFDSK